MEKIIIKGAKEHNLKNVSLEIPRDKLIVFTGLSGSGKSSLAFDTIYAEGQRRYVESLSSYARMFLGQMEKPDVEKIEGLSPAISIDQKTTGRNPRSTVGTVTEIYDYLRVLYARIGIPHCPNCKKEIKQQTIDQITDAVLDYGEGSKILVLAPVVRDRKGEHQKVFENAKKSGYVRVRVDGDTYDLSEEIKLDRNKKHNIEIVIDRLVVKDGIRARFTDSVETATNLSGGIVIIHKIDDKDYKYSLNYACPDCNISIDELSPRMFSFNNPMGACPECGGLGHLMKIDKNYVLNGELSIRDGGIAASGWNYKGEDTMADMYYSGLAKKYGFSLDTPVKDLPQKAIDVILYGTNGEKYEMVYKKKYGGGTFMGEFEGVINNLERRYKETKSNWIRNDIEALMTKADCHICGGARLKPEALSVTVNGKNISEITKYTVIELLEFFEKLELNEREFKIAGLLIKEIKERLFFLKDVGLDYLTLSRSAGTLSGGEAQRIRLATQIGSSLMGVLYILDEPSIGLHQRDNDRLLATLKKLRDLGNTLIVVEHDEDTIRSADYIVDIGPGAGIHGGEVVAAGTVPEIMKSKKSITAKYLTGEYKIDVPSERRVGNGSFIEVKGARENNLKNINVKFPLGCLCAVTGVSGSGKSSLVNQILYRELAHRLNGARLKADNFDDITGVEHLDKIINIDQSPIGRTPRSNPATYTGVFSDIREVFASTLEARLKGYDAGRFSFNVKGGRCEACQGDGVVTIEMHFLADVNITCDVCKGMRYNRETLEIKYKDKNIFEVLDMTVEEGIEFFDNIPKIKRKLEVLRDVGLSYIKLGQPSTTLSGGEAQRVKLATELSKKATGRTLYVLDEPTTGLHTDDVKKLIEVIQKLTDNGNTVVVIEHNLDVIKTADYIVDLGPEGGNRGGCVVATGTPEEIAKNKNSHTGKYLKKYLK